MNALNHVVSSVFDALMAPFELMGDVWALIVVSCLFTVVALLLFKKISWQKGIKQAKDKIKGHMIAIRIYQDDLAIVGTSVLKVVVRNFQYLGLNFGPILPLFIPFALVVAQFVVRYAYAPLPVVDEARAAAMLPGAEGTTLIEIDLKDGRKDELSDLTVTLPPELKALSPLMHSALDGKAYQEVVATRAGTGEIEVLVGGKRVASKDVAAGDVKPRLMQPERVASQLEAILYPAEETIPSDSPVERISFHYPDRKLPFLMDGEFGMIMNFLIISMVFGILIIKPLKIQI